MNSIRRTSTNWAGVAQASRNTHQSVRAQQLLQSSEPKPQAAAALKVLTPKNPPLHHTRAEKCFRLHVKHFSNQFASRAVIPVQFPLNILQWAWTWFLHKYIEVSKEEIYTNCTRGHDQELKTCRATPMLKKFSHLDDYSTEKGCNCDP